ncbi:hypothetical protein AADZ90_013560 [Aestuariibius sp. 2305UL40-4]|uniref:hypothetical protein n=1 Tax=Aestuariibius violaceus TaxID=3234132 RepID=UPI00345E7085
MRFLLFMLALPACVPVGAPRIEETGTVLLVVNTCDEPIEVSARAADGSQLGQVQVASSDADDFLVPSGVPLTFTLSQPGQPDRAITFEETPDGTRIHRHTTCRS